MHNNNLLQFDAPALENALKELILRESGKNSEMLPETLRDDEPFFGSASRLALDSLDALQIAVALQSRYRIRLQGARAVRRHMADIHSLAAYIRSQCRAEQIK